MSGMPRHATWSMPDVYVRLLVPVETRSFPWQATYASQQENMCKRLSARRMLQGLRQQQCCPESVQVPDLVQKAWYRNAQFNSGRWHIFEIFRGHPVSIRYEHIRTALLVYNIKKRLFSKVSPWRCTVQHQSASQRLVYGHLDQLNLGDWLENALYVGCLLPIRFVDPSSTK